jgi:CHAD domain-containing protein
MTSVPCPPQITIEDFGMKKTAALLQTAAKAIHAASRSPDPEAIHRMRVSIRRLQQSIRLFRQFLRKKGVRSVRAELRSIMEHAGELRNYDIALKLLRAAGGPRDPLRERRVTVRLVLQAQLADMSTTHLAERWLNLLGIPSENLEA